MARIRFFEQAIAGLWRQGLISGEMHLGTGEEAIVAGVVAHLLDGDALAFDHRCSPPLVALGVDLSAILLELLGHEAGLCRGRGGHMHLCAPDHLAASSGIVGASGPLACGFALAASQLRPGRVAVSFFGEGAANQGMLMESLNLAVVWRLPVVFICKDDGFAVTTHSPSVTGGNVLARARSMGIAILAEVGSTVRYGRVATEGTIPYARYLEAQALPGVDRIVQAALRLMDHEKRDDLVPHGIGTPPQGVPAQSSR